MSSEEKIEIIPRPGDCQIVDVELPKDVVVLPFLGFPVEEVTELDWHRREKEQQAIHKDLMDEVAAQQINDEIRQRAIWEERRQRPIRQAKEHLASCSDEKDAESCAYWKAQRERLFNEHMERARILAEADAAYICKRDLPSMDRDAWISEMKSALGSFTAALEEEAEDWEDMANGKISIERHREEMDDVKNEMFGLRTENQFYKTTNRVLTILLIFSTAFGVAAALAWLRCQ